MKKTSLAVVFFLFLAVFVSLSSCSYWSGPWTDDDYHYGKGVLPWRFYKGDHYPENDEEIECRPIKLHVARGTKKFKELVKFPSNYKYLHFETDDCRIMSSRLYSRLSKLAYKYYKKYGIKLLVRKAWTPYPDNSLYNTSLHYEGRSVQIQVTWRNVTRLLRLAVNHAEFDWVSYEWNGCARLSVIPDACEANLDVVFVMDQSGSIGPDNHAIALNFLRRVVDFFNVGSNMTQVSLITYSTHARVRFDLNDFTTKPEVLSEIARVRYTGGWTATGLGLFQAGVILNPNQQRGARPFSEGIPRVVILLTDGRSNRVPVDDVATALHKAGVQVYTVGIGNIYLPELKFIASDPDPYHIFLLDSFTDAGGFVDFLSYTTCDTPAVVEPGENTTTEVPEDGFRFFQTECTAFSTSVTVIVEQIDIIGKCNLYASTVKPNPGPLDNSSVVVKNEDLSTDKRYVVLSSVKKFIYISIRGIRQKNMFTVIIWDRLFRLEEYTVTAPEGIPNHAFFNLTQEVTVTTEKYYFRIKEGNDNDDFEIDNITGILSTSNELSISRQQSYRLLIIAENRNASCHRGKVIVNVNVVPNRLEFINTMPVNVSEGFTGNVTRVTAIGTQSDITYSIISGNVGNAFAINGTTGDIRAIGTLDFETTPRYQLTIQARTSFGSSASTVQIINILDINERPVFVTSCATSNNCQFSIFENSPLNTVVGRIIASDPDASNTPNGTLTYTRAPSTVPFSIDSTNGTIRVSGGTLDRENEDVYTLTVRVSDNGSPNLFITTVVRIRLLDRNDNAPVFVNPTRQLSISENTTINTVIARYTATDRDIGNNAVIAFTLQSSISNLPFSINSGSGNLIVSGPLDYDLGIRLYPITITASNPDGLRTSINITVTITDINDNTPQFINTPITGRVIEHSAIGTPVTRVQATDGDSGVNGQIVYSIESAINLFAINSTSGEITVNGTIDREMVNMFTITVRAQDLGSPTLSNTTNVKITVIDINDNAPIFRPDVIRLTIPENHPLSDLTTLMATDADQPGTPNSLITYSIESGNINNHFSINSTTGVLSLVSALDFEQIRSFTLNILARDNGSPSMNGTATVIITITNINDHPPVISGNVVENVPEDQPIGSRLAQFNATDLDQMAIHFTLRNSNGSPSNLFAINRTTGIVTLIGALDFETATRHVLIITANDTLHTDQATLTINVLDVNEFSPVFISPNQFAVNESQPSGTVVGTVSARDGDTSNEIMYFLMPNTVSGLFRLNSSTGVLTTSSVLDREGLVEENHFLPPGSNETLVVMATDNGDRPGPRSSSQNLTIILNDINDNRPIFNPTQYQDTIPENTNGTTPLFTVRATDRDLGVNAVIRYSLPGQVSNSFTINPVTGLVSAIRPFDRENANDNNFNFIITARDQGTPQLSATASARVIVTDINDNAPLFTSNNDFELEVAENTRVNQVITQINVIDIDQGVNARINITSREGSNDCSSNPSSCFFSIDNNGIVRVVRPLDYETQTQHNIILIATDNGNPSLSSTQLLIINVTNVDERGPEFIGSCDATVSEGVARGTLVTVCPARDFDEVAGQFTNLITYSIIQGNEEQLFAIDSNDANITTRLDLDREKESVHRITIRATDRGGLSSTTQVTITVSDINDNTPQINGPFEIYITNSDIRSYRRIITNITASDADIGNNAAIVYSIANRSITEDETLLTVSATDRGTPNTLSNSTTVNVTFESSCVSQSYSIDSNTGVITATLLCQISISPSLVQVNVGNSFTLACNVLRNIDVQVQFLQNSSSVGSSSTLSRGNMVVNYVQDNVTFDHAGTYNCRAGSLQTSQPSEVQVQVPPTITVPPSSAVLNVGTGIFVLVCVAVGVPTPTISWTKNNSPLQASARIQAVRNQLMIANIEQEDQGEYTCIATNRAGNDTATATLTIARIANLLAAEVVLMSNADPILNCNTFNKQQFEQSMSQITKHRTVVTNTQGTSLCPTDACHPNPCVNGTCNVTGTNSYQCKCTPGFMGRNCDEDINECKYTTCLNGGTCENIKGGFKCHCPNGYYGDQCAYNHAQCLCPPGAVCNKTADGTTVCIVSTSRSHVTIDGPNVNNIGALDNTVNTLMEDPPSSSKRRKRNGFVTVCTGRFVPITGSTSLYLLVWVCPDSAQPPNDDKLTQICQSLVYSNLVRVCHPPGNKPPIQLGDVPPSSLNITLILFDANGRVISSQEAMTIMETSGALDKMSQNGFNISRFRVIEEPRTLSHSATSTNVGVSIGGVIGALLVIGIIALSVVLVLKYRKRKNKRIRVPVIEMNDKGTTLSNAMINDNSEDRYSRVPVSLPPIKDTSLEYSEIERKDSGPSSPLRSPVQPYTLFDDPVYTKPPGASIKRKSVKRSTLERAKDHQIHKSGSLEKLLDSDNEEETTKSIKSLEDGDEPIYSNMNYVWEGKAGQRWENYWKANTVIRGASPPK